MPLIKKLSPYCFLIFFAIVATKPAHAQPTSHSTTVSAAAAPVVVSGVVPDEATRQAILARVREVYGSARVVDKLGVGVSSAPANWAENVKKLVSPELKNIRRGQLKISGNEVELIGATDSTEISEKIAAGIKASLNPTYTVRTNLQVDAAPQAKIDSILINKVVEFDPSSPQLTAKGIAVLDELLPVLSGLDGKKIQIIGHTDADGLRELNMKLSQNRAMTVKRYLVSKGMADALIFTTGKGPDAPIDNSGTQEGKAKNRRIEFKILN